jgi:hypothetical protein
MMSTVNDLSPATIDVIIPQGSDIQEFYQLYADEAQTIPLDLTVFKARAMLRKTYDSKTPVLSLSSDAGTIILGAQLVGGQVVQGSATNGGIAILYKNADTTNIRFQDESLECIRDLEVYTQGVNPKVRRIVQGTVTILREVTR